MPRYADGFVIVVPKKNLKAYEAMSKKAGKIWKEYGALEYCECVGEDLKVKFGTPFPKLCKPKVGKLAFASNVVCVKWSSSKAAGSSNDRSTRTENELFICSRS